MTKKNISITTAMLITLSLPLAQAGVGMPGTITVADLARETAAKKTLTRAQASAGAVADEADQLRRIANPMFSPDSHRDKLTALKGKVNRMGQEISSLRAERESLAPWEQQAIDEILPLLQVDCREHRKRNRVLQCTRGPFVDGDLSRLRRPHLAGLRSDCKDPQELP